MSPAIVERGVAARADSRFYTGGPPLSTYESPVAASLQLDQLGNQPPIAAMRKRRQFLVYAEFAHVNRHSWKHSKTGSTPKPRSKSFAFEPIDTTGLASHQVFELVGELAARPRPSFASSGQSTENLTERVADRDDDSSFPAESGDRLRFADIQVSSDEDLIEAGYRFYARVEDPELAAESRRAFLERLGLGPE